MCSGESIPPRILIVGVPDLVVALIGSCLFKPQSPLLSEVVGVSRAARVGYGLEAVSEFVMRSDEGSVGGSDTGEGMAKSLELRSRLAAGDRRAAVIAAMSGWLYASWA